MIDPDERSYQRLRRQRPASTEVVGRPQLHRLRHMNLYTGTQLSVNTFFAQLEQPDRPLRALPAGQGDGRPPDRPDHRDGPVVHPRRRRRRARSRWPSAYATFAARGLHCDAAAGHRDRGLRRPQAQGVPAAVPAGDRRSAWPTPSTTCSAASRTPRRLRYDAGPGPRPAVGRQDRHHRQTTWRCGSSATPPTWPPPRWSPAPTSRATGSP